MANALNIPLARLLGPQALQWDTYGAGSPKVIKVFGDGPMFTVTQSTATAQAQITGQTPREEVITGTVVELSAVLAEPTIADLLALVPGASTVQAGAAVKFNTAVGVSLRETAKELIIKPLRGETVSTDDDEWIFIPKAGIHVEFNNPLSLETQQAYAVRFKAFPVLADDLATGGALFGSDYSVGELWRASGTDYDHTP